MALNFNDYQDMMIAVKELNTDGFRFITDYINFIIVVKL